MGQPWGIKTHLSGKEQFDLVYKKGRSLVSKEIIIKALPNELNITRYGLTVSRRVGKAVVRNRVKRRLREILRKMNLMAGWDLIVIARNPAATADFTSIEKSVESLLVRAGLFVGENEDNRSGDD